MLQSELFKVIKGKKIRFFYQSVVDILNWVDDLESENDLNLFIRKILAYKNGFIDSDKRLKNLRSIHLKYPYLYIDWLIEYAKIKIEYLKHPKIKKLDHLLIYAESQSLFGYLFLITDQNAHKHLQLIHTLAKIDVLSDILKNANTYKKNDKIHFPEQLIEDYHLEVSLDGKYMINDRFIALWNLLAVKINTWIQEIKMSLFSFSDIEVTLIHTFIHQTKMHLKTIE